MHTSRTARTWVVAGALGTALLLVPANLAAAKSPAPPGPVVKSSALAAPFNLAFTRSGVLVADGGLNLVGKLASNGQITPIATGQPGASGVAEAGGTLAFTTTVTKPETFENTASGLNLWSRNGKHKYVDTLAYETANNPDSVNAYGVANPSQCVSDALAAAQFPVSYTGQVDSHAYSVAAYKGDWIVADAGANALLRVNRKGSVRTIAVLPPQPAKITAEAAAALGLPDCVVGVTYAFEPVPTDVEVGRDGYLYVTTLPGGPESAVLGARGALWKINPRNGKARQLAGGFLGATNLALGSHGKVYVAEFYAGRISVVKRSGKATFLTLPGVVAVETDRRGQLWAATLGSQDPAVPGTLVKVSGTGKGHWPRVKLTHHRALALGWPLRK
jgi:hypothetical protein